MEIRRFFSQEPVLQHTVAIGGDECHHIRSVNRLRPGDPIEVIDGCGHLYTGTIRTISREQVTVHIQKEEREEPSTVETILAPSLLKPKAMTLLVEKLSEMGIDQIRPVLYSRTDIGCTPPMLKKWQRLAAQSLKVNKRLWLTAIYPPVTLQELLSWARGSGVRTPIVLDLEGPGGDLPPFLPPVCCLVGPPGDFTPQEKEQIAQNHFIPYRLNPCTLKTETAALAAAALLRAHLP
jgi:16S rRNA (uracil1498-N3)-methyltransferase